MRLFLGLFCAIWVMHPACANITPPISGGNVETSPPVVPATILLHGAVEYDSGTEPDNAQAFAREASRCLEDYCGRLSVFKYLANIQDPDKRRRAWRRILNHRFRNTDACPMAGELTYVKDAKLRHVESLAARFGVPIR